MNKKLFFVLIPIVFLISCVPHRELTMLNVPSNKMIDSLMSIQNLPAFHIQPDDRLSIEVSAFDPETAAPFAQPFIFFVGNQGGGNNNQGNIGNLNNINQQGGLQLLQGYLVDERGNIEYPIIGTINLQGLTLEAAKDTMYSKLSKYLVDYSVDVRYLNRRITVTGEVSFGGNVIMDRNRISILDALQRAGGLTPYSNRREVLVIREIAGQRIVGKLDLKSKDIINSPFYYMQPNDIVYVDPTKYKSLTLPDPFGRVISYVAGVLSAASVAIVLFR